MCRTNAFRISEINFTVSKKINCPMTQSSANCMKWNWSSAAAGYVELPLSYIAGDQEEIHQNGRKQDMK